MQQRGARRARSAPDDRSLLPRVPLQVVERLVRAGLKRVASGDASPHQALQGVVSRLASELPDGQYASLLSYFQDKKTNGTLTPAKHLLLKALRAAKPTGPQARGEQQQQQAAPASAPSEQRAQKQPLQPLQQQQQPHVGTHTDQDARKQQQQVQSPPLSAKVSSWASQQYLCVDVQ